MELAFSSYSDSRVGNPINILDFCIDGLFFIDIIIAFNTPIHAKEYDAYFGDRTKIAEQYLQTWFLIDLISSIPLEAFVSLGDSTNNSNFTIIRLVKTVRLIRLYKLVKKVNFSALINRLEEYFKIPPAFLSLLLTLFEVGVVSHCLCCVWWGLCTVLTNPAWFDQVRALIFFF